MLAADWIALILGALGLAGIFGTVVYNHMALKQVVIENRMASEAAAAVSHATIEQKIESVHKCQNLSLRLIARNGRVLKKHIKAVETRFESIEEKLS